jgi:hypothetical protein
MRSVIGAIVAEDAAGVALDTPPRSNKRPSS